MKPNSYWKQIKIVKFEYKNIPYLLIKCSCNNSLSAYCMVDLQLRFQVFTWTRKWQNAKKDRGHCWWPPSSQTWFLWLLTNCHFCSVHVCLWKLWSTPAIFKYPKARNYEDIVQIREHTLLILSFFVTYLANKRLIIIIFRWQLYLYRLWLLGRSLWVAWIMDLGLCLLPLPWCAIFTILVMLKKTDLKFL